MVADLTVNMIYYPNENNDKNLGIVLASYACGSDSTRLLGLADEDVFQEMMNGMAKIHGVSVE